MKNRAVRIFLFLLVSLQAASAIAATVTLVPGSATFNAGDLVQVNAVISGLGNHAPPSVGAFDVSVGYNPLLLAPDDVTFGLLLGDPFLFEALTDVDFLTPGIANFAEVSLLSPSELDALQPVSSK